MVERSGSLDVWVNNAGHPDHRAWPTSSPSTSTARMLDVNAVGTFNGTLAAIERMRRSGRGRIINLISLAGLAAATGIVGYSASKHAAIAFSLGTAADLRRAGLGGITISCVCPDGVWTPMINDKLDDPNDALSFSGVMLMPEQVAERVEGLLDKPKPVLTIPRWRGRFVALLRPPPAALAAPHPAADARRPPPPARLQAEGGVGQVAAEVPVRGPHDPGSRAGRFHTARGPMGLAGWLRYPAAWLRAAVGPGPGAALDRPRRGRLAGTADPRGLVGPRARLRPLDRLVRAARRARAQPRGQRVLDRRARASDWRSGRAASTPSSGCKPVEEFPREVAALADESFDLVVVDFLEAPAVTRIDALEPALRKVRPGGLLLLDDSDRPGYAKAYELLCRLARASASPGVKDEWPEACETDDLHPATRPRIDRRPQNRRGPVAGASSVANL